ncbi:MAG: Choline-sulfatase [Candidatus Hydrogenedentes bacterium ADurb.Bin101]|nr:MAG: Choline-sulfatase [Candidatus Hydrogenedentes bacterium ADurb.Bin101]HOC68665.1 sulfatase-like hydrolase/transferase [Candidatus Hydrogenedentota bacterium]
MHTFFTTISGAASISNAVCAVIFLASLSYFGCSPPIPEETPSTPTPAPVQKTIPTPEVSTVAHGTPADHPNIIWVILDACRPDFSCYGYDRPTSPTIDALAAEGALFESHYTQGLWTKLSVPTYMTGRYYPVSCLDFIDYGSNANCPREVPPGELLLPEILKANGYHTVLVSAQVYITPRSRLYKAFDESYAVQPAAGAAYADFEALNQVILRKLAEPRDKPFFLYVHAMDTHFPHVLKSPYDRWIDPEHISATIQNGQPLQKTGSQFTKEDRNLLRGMHDGSILYADQAIGVIVKALKEQGLYENTLLLIGADHGDALGEDGTSWGHEVTFDAVTHVPFMLTGPGIPKGMQVSTFTQNVDIVPTLIELLQLDTTARPEGKSLLPLLRGETDSLHEYVFTRWYSRGYDNPNGYIIRNKTHKYEYDPMDGHEALYLAPDTVAGRVPCLDTQPETAGRFRELRSAVFEPLWQAYDRQPKLYHDVRFNEAFLGGMPNPPETIRIFKGNRPDADTPLDGAWILMNDLLWAAPWTEAPAPLILRHQVPPGRYLLTLLLLSAGDILGHPASMVRIKPAGEEAFREVVLAPGKDASERLPLVEAGYVDLPNGVFEMTLSPGDPPYWSAIGGFRLTAAETVEPASNMPDQQQTLDQLRALGYL